MRNHVFTIVLLSAVGGIPVVRAADAPKPVKVFVLAGQSNMEGQAVVDLDGKNYNDGKGTLNALFKDPAKAPLVKHLKNAKGAWTVRDDVWVRYQREKQPLLAGALTIGFSVYGDKHHFGPELQFGHVIGDHFENQVLLIKTAWGGKSLYKDFRPPSSGGVLGPYYTKMIAEIRQGLENLKTDFPGYQGQGYELAGFVWYHGWNDGVDPKKAVPEYEQNLVNLINDVRKEFKLPKLPCVIGELTGPWVHAPGAWDTLRKAQAAAAARPEFKGNVIFVATHDFVRPANESPNPGHGHHEFGNAETYFLVGDALAKGMIKLLAPPANEPGKSALPPAIDAHTHFYDPARPQGVPWPSKDDKLLYRTVLPGEFKKLTQSHRIVGTIVVEASPWLDDNQWLLDLAARDPFIVGVVGRLDPNSDDFAKNFARFAKDPLFRGIRIGQAELRRGMGRQRFLDNLRLLVKHDRTLDVNGGPETPADVARLAQVLPDLRIVIDHAANLKIDGKPVPAEWRKGMRAAAAGKNVFCKVSALVESTGRTGGAAPTTVEFYRPTLDALWDTFGEDRLIYASNWPVCTNAASYATVHAVVHGYCEQRGPAAVEKFFSGNAVAAYKPASLQRSK